MHMHGHEFMQREETRNRRTTMIQGWVREDLAADNQSLSEALLKWREELMERLTSRRPLLIRIPRIFVEHLGLPSQKVIINESHEVRQVLIRNGQDAQGVQTGQVIVPPKV